MYSQDQLIEMLLKFRQLPTETEWIEFKEAKNNFDFDTFGQYFSALSNEANLKKQHSAWMIFGIQDQYPHKIVGTKYRPDAHSLNTLKHEIAKQTNGLSFQEIYDLSLPEGRVLLFQIPAAPTGIPTSWKGHYYGRDGTSLGSLSMKEIENIRQQIGISDWTVQICQQATLQDLDKAALDIAQKKIS